MKFFVDTAEMKSPVSGGRLDGVNANPSLVAKTGKGFTDIIREIRAIFAGPVSAEVAAAGHDGMMREAAAPRETANNDAIKASLTPDGVRACKKLVSGGALVPAEQW